MASYSSMPKPRRGHRRVSGGGSVSGAEPLLVGVTTPPASGTSSVAGFSAKKTDAQNPSSQKAGSQKAGSPKAGSQKAGSPKAGSQKAGSPNAGSQKAATSAQPLTPEERERLEWMRQQRPPHWGNNIV